MTQKLIYKSNTATFLSKKEIGFQTWEYTFSFTDEISWKPGDYTYITLQKRVSTPDSRGLRRHISIAFMDLSKKKFRIAVRLRDSAFKQELHGLQKGDTIEYTAPYGELILPRQKNVPLAFIIGGIGITAVLSVFEESITKGSKHPITLIYFNKSQKTTVYTDLLESYKTKLSNFHLIFSMTQEANWKGENRKVSEDFIVEYIPNFLKTHFYIVGPERMCQAVEDELYDLNIADEQIWREDFTGY